MEDNDENIKQALMHQPNLMPNSFFEAYVEAALWSSHDAASGDNFDSYSNKDLSPEARMEMYGDCVKFWLRNRRLIGRQVTQAGHDFWLTRNGHGAGFWDRPDDVWPKETRDLLTAEAHKFREQSLYSHYGQIYIE